MAAAQKVKLETFNRWSETKVIIIQSSATIFNFLFLRRLALLLHSTAATIKVPELELEAENQSEVCELWVGVSRV